jgi:hypothetical protein
MKDENIRVQINTDNTTQNIRVTTKLPNYEQSYKGKVKTHKYINRQNENRGSLRVFTGVPVADLYNFTEFGTALTTILPILFQYC